VFSGFNVSEKFPNKIWGYKIRIGKNQASYMDESNIRQKEKVNRVNKGKQGAKMPAN